MPTHCQSLLNPDVHPVIQPLLHVPLALRDEMAGELSNLLEARLIEPVNVLQWISNMVTVEEDRKAVPVH